MADAYPNHTVAMTAPDKLIGLFADSEARLRDEYAEIIAEPRAQYRARRLRSLIETVSRETAELKKQSGVFLTEVLPTVYATGATSTAVAAGAAEYVWTEIGRTAMQVLAQSTFDKVLLATTYMEEDAKRWVRDATKQITIQGSLEGENAAGLARRFKQLAPKAVSATGAPMPISAITYADGSVRTIDTYAEMLFRTDTAKAYNQGVITTGDEFGVVAYEFFDGSDCGLTSHDDPQKANGMIVSRETALRHPISHPNCVRSAAARPDLGVDSIGVLDPTQPTATSNPTDLFVADKPTPQLGRSDPRTAAQTTYKRPPVKPPKAKPAVRANPGVKAKPPSQAKLAPSAAKPPAASKPPAAKKPPAKKPPVDPIEQAKREAAKIEEARKAAIASKFAERARVQDELGDLLAAWEISPDEFLNADRRVDAIRSGLRSDAKQIASKTYDDMPVRELSIPPPLRRQTDLATGRSRMVRDQAEWEWYDALPDAERQAMRRKWFAEDARTNPDQIGNAWDFTGNTKITTDEGVDLWLTEVRKVDGATDIAQGRATRFVNADEVFDGFDSPTVNGLRELGLPVSEIIGETGAVGSVPRLPKFPPPTAEQIAARERQVKDLAEFRKAENLAQRNLAAAKLAAAEQDQLVAQAGGIFQAKTSSPRPFQMTPEEYAAELTSMRANQEVIDAIDGFLDGDVYAPGSRPALWLGRWEELVPFDLDIDDPVGSYERLRHIAVRANMVDEAGNLIEETVDEALVEAAARAAAVNARLDQLDDF